MAGATATEEMSNMIAQKFVGNSTGEMLNNTLKVAIMTPFFLFWF